MNNRIDYQKIGKKYGINVMFGTVLKEETPHVIMIRCKGRIKPNIRKKNYEDDIEKLKYDIINIINSKVRNSNVFFQECLANTDISSRSIKYNKYSFIKYDVYVKPNVLKTISLHKEDISRLTNEINLSISERLGKDFTLKMD